MSVSPPAADDFRYQTAVPFQPEWATHGGEDVGLIAAKIDTAEVGDDGQYIVRGLLPTNIQHVDTVPVFNTRQNRITFLSLVDTEYKEIAQEKAKIKEISR